MGHQIPENVIDKHRRMCYNPEAVVRLITERREDSAYRMGQSSSTRVRVDCRVGPPVPIPNTEVKLMYADNTWRATAREDR